MSVFNTIRLSPDDQKQAQAYLHEQVYNRVFLDKMAQLGYPVNSQEAAAELLRLDHEMQLAESRPQPATNRYKSAAAALRRARGLPDTSAELVSQAEEDEAIKLAAWMAEQDQDLYFAALGLKVEEARAAGQLA